MLLLGGFILGFIGSLHCVGMCGPIVLALPWKSDSRSHFIGKQVFYYISKALAYATLGLLSGLIGDTFRFFGFQQAVSITLGIVMLVFGLGSLLKLSFLRNLFFFDKVFSGLRSLFHRFIKTGSPASFLAIGYLNGLLPCGFVYIGLASAIMTNSVLDAAFFMFLFGLGTIPAMLTASLLPSFIRIKRNFPTRKLVPIFSIVFAILFILRGLNLGIPYISPQMHAQAAASSPRADVNCCK